MSELYPLSKNEFESLYDKAWEYGWVYGKFFQELYDEYLVNWVYFVDYLDVLKGADEEERMYARVQKKFVIVYAKNQKPILIEAKDYFKDHFTTTTDTTKPLKSIEILIGEAPPFWKGNAKNEDKSYFYNPNYFEKKGSWITAPLAFKELKRKLESSALVKTECLSFLAKTRMFLFDVFPFPIIQDTKIRQAVSGEFPKHIAEYFIPKLETIITYIGVKKTNITYGFVATTYGSLHLLFGNKTRAHFEKFDPKFYSHGINLKDPVIVTAIEFVFDAPKGTATNYIAGYSLNPKKKIYEPTVLFKTIYKLICPEEDFEDSFYKIINEASFKLNIHVKKLNDIFKKNKIPILMNHGGHVNFNTFFNGPKPSIEKFETEEKIL